MTYPAAHHDTGSRPPRGSHLTTGGAWRRLLPLLLAMLLPAGCGIPLAGGTSSGGASQPPLPAKSVDVVEFLHTQSDQAQEAGHVATFERVIVPEAVAKSSTVIVLVVGDHGFTAPHKVAEVSFSGLENIAQGNPQTLESLKGQRRSDLVSSVRSQLKALPYSALSDPFGGAAAAASVLAQYPASIPRRLTVFGDEMANQPEGCVLSSRDLTQVKTLLQVCTGGRLPSLPGVAVSLIGAGYDIDGEIPTSTAQNLQPFLTDFYEQAGAQVVRYGPLFANTAPSR